jgi:hypothetical protein
MVRRVLRVLIPTLAVATGAHFVFQRFYECGDNSSDHAAHLDFIRKGTIPIYPLYHFSVQALAGWDNQNLVKSAPVVLTLAVTAVAALSAAYLAARTRATTFTLTVVCLILSVVMPLPTIQFFRDFSTFYWDSPSPPGSGIFLGQITPNVWHNPTTIFAMPFAVAAYWAAVSALDNFSMRSAVVLGVTMVLSLLAKPNYVLAMLPCLGLALAAKPMSLVDKIMRLFVVFVLPLVVLWGQAAVLVGPKGSTSEEMLIAPFDIWQRFSKNITVSSFVGVVFPLCVLFAYRGRFDGETPLKFAWVVLGMSVLEYSLLKESGERATAGNWFWGTVFADHILFLASCEYLLRQRLDLRKVACWFVLLLHVGTGGVNLAKCLIDPPWSLFF